MKQRRDLLKLIGATILATPLSALAETPKPPRRIGYLGAGSKASAAQMSGAFHTALRELGWAEGRDIVIEERFSDGDVKIIEKNAAELAAMNLELIFAPTTQATLAVRRYSRDVAIVFAVPIDPIGSGLVSNLAHPGGNSTGLASIGAELMAKRLQLLGQCVPKLSRVVVLSEPGFSSNVLAMVLNAGKQQGFAMSVIHATNEAEIEQVFRKLAGERPDGLFIAESPLFLRHRQMTVARALAMRISTVSPNAEFVDEGGLLSYGSSYNDQYRRAATYVDKILKGSKPGDLPVEQPMRFELMINMRTAKALGLKIPQTVLLSADKVIE